jgi:hypothetical protein
MGLKRGPYMKIMKCKISLLRPFNPTNHLVSCERPTSGCVCTYTLRELRPSTRTGLPNCWTTIKKILTGFTPSSRPASCVGNTQLVIHGLINYIDTKGKCRHLKNIDLFRQLFIRVPRLEIQSVMLVFSTQICELLPL